MNKQDFLLYCDGQKKPVGIDNARPVFSWKLNRYEHDKRQLAYHIMLGPTRVSIQNHCGLLWSHTEETASMKTVYSKDRLESKRIYYWKVIIRCSDGQEIHSDISHFETGFIEKSCWKAQWISPDEDDVFAEVPELDQAGNPPPIELANIKMGPVYQLRKIFDIGKNVVKARLYATAHGIYIPYINGRRAGCFELAPEHTSYHNQLLYQIYDVTEYLEPGNHRVRRR